MTSWVIYPGIYVLEIGKHSDILKLLIGLESEVKVKVSQLCPTLCDPTDYTVHGILQARILEWVAFPFSRASSHPGIEPRSPALRADTLPAEPQGKPKNTGVGIEYYPFSSRSSRPRNQTGLMHCRWILYPLSCQESPECVS